MYAPHSHILCSNFFLQHPTRPPKLTHDLLHYTSYYINRFILLLLLVYSIILSCMVVSSCHFISAITPPNANNNDTESTEDTEEETHGVGITTFENQLGECEPHNSFVIDNYNGMEMTAKVGGYVAPTLGCLVCVWLLGECCMKGGCWGGKCKSALGRWTLYCCCCIVLLISSFLTHTNVVSSFFIIKAYHPYYY